MKDSIEHLEWRYAVKRFDSNKQLTVEKVESLKHVFNLTATSYGLQPIKLVVLRNKATQGKLIPFSFGQEQVSEASHVLILCIENKIDEDFISNYFTLVKKTRGTSDEILDPFKKSLVTSFSKKDAKEVKIWATNQAYLALGNLLSYCAIEKIDSCPMEGFQPENYDKILGLDKQGLTSVLVLPVGYRHEDDMFSTMKKVRKPLSQSIINID